jgi:hypothetical protein
MRCKACDNEFSSYKRKIVTEEQKVLYIDEDLCNSCRNKLASLVDDPSDLGVDVGE